MLSRSFHSLSSTSCPGFARQPWDTLLPVTLFWSQCFQLISEIVGVLGKGHRGPWHGPEPHMNPSSAVWQEASSGRVSGRRQAEAHRAGVARTVTSPGSSPQALSPPGDLMSMRVQSGTCPVLRFTSKLLVPQATLRTSCFLTPLSTPISCAAGILR